MGPAWTYTKRGYALSQSIRQLKRHKLASIGTLLALGITLALPTLLYFASATLSSIAQQSVRDESLTAYLSLDTSDANGAALAEQWQGRENVERTQYISRDQALAMLAENTDIGDAVALLDANPLPGAIVVYPKHAAAAQDMDALASELRAVSQVTQVQLDLRWVRRLEAAVHLGKWIGGLLAGFLTLTALLVLLNTIRLELSRRRTEMQVTSLLGAPASFMYRPIVYTGALYGFLGGFVACVLALVTLNAIRSPADELSSLYQSPLFMQMPSPSQIFIVLGISLAMGLVGALGSLYRPSRQLTHSG